MNASNPMMETLESRRLLSGSVLRIQAGSVPDEVINVHLAKKGVLYNVNGGKDHFVGYSRRLAEVDVIAGDWLGGANSGTHGNHTLNVTVDYHRVNLVRVIGRNAAINHINIVENTTTSILVEGGNSSVNYLTERGLAPHGYIKLLGGNNSTNYFSLGTGYNQALGGNSASNIFSVTALDSSGVVSAGSNSNDVLQPLDGKLPVGYAVYGKVAIQ